mmetsp:Transcript_28363/g.52975  ORF Transcript_28363/g.52975 Transcript_28363/m.52975 type:complete len:105 (+) Transcript_28363:1042-1356(+)
MNGKSKMRTPVTVTLDTPFLQAVEKVMGNGIHRLWVTGTDEGEKKKVKGALSLTDIIYKFSTFDLSRHPIKEVTERLPAKDFTVTTEYVVEYRTVPATSSSTGT